MDELKKKTMNIITQINNEWVDAVREAEENQVGLDILDLPAKFAQHQEKLDLAFAEAKERLRHNNKKGWF